MIKLRDPRVAVRALLGVLLAANLGMAILAFRPFGGGADDLRSQQAALDQELSAAKNHLAQTRQIVEKVQTARKQGDDFMKKYITDIGTASSAMIFELNRMAEQSGVRQLPVTLNRSGIEGSDTIKMVALTDGCEGTYQQLAKYINLIDKSAQFLMIESLQTAAPQAAGNAQKLNVQLKIDTFINGEGEPQ
jgi:type IV pilus assembly protein PilO